MLGNDIHGAPKKGVEWRIALECPHLGNHEAYLQSRRWGTHEQRQAMTFMGLRKKRGEWRIALEGPHLGNHEA